MPPSLLKINNAYIKFFMYESSLTRLPSTRPSPSSSVNQHLQTSIVPQGDAEFAVVYTIPYHASKLIESGLDLVQPSKWTNVSNDDDLMRALLYSYFKLEYCSWPVFQKDYFLRDMQHQRTTCCSALLVNSILAHAAVSSNPAGALANLTGLEFSSATKLSRITARIGTPEVLPINFSPSLDVCGSF